MRKKEVFITLLACVFILFSLTNMFLIHLFSPINSPNFLTGNSFTTGSIALIVEGGANTVSISSPENKTYNFNVGDVYLIDLNVSADFTPTGWKYTLYDLTNDKVQYEDILFTPNITFSAVRWSNKMTVFANDSGNNWYNASVVFYVQVPNSAPIIEYIADEIYVCEGEYLSYYFNATDVDRDVLNSDINPDNTFYSFPVYSLGLNRTRFEIISGVLDKGDAGGTDVGFKLYEKNVVVQEIYTSEQYSDTEKVNLTVIEINNEPDVDNVGVQTVWTAGENSTFYKQISVVDIEDGNATDGALGFNISIHNSTSDLIDLFEITPEGVMNFTPG